MARLSRPLVSSKAFAVRPKVDADADADAISMRCDSVANAGSTTGENVHFTVIDQLNSTE